MNRMTIGQLAAKVAVNVQTIRYYERRGLLLAPVRSDAGYRYYSDEAVSQIRFIKRAQQLGFSLDEIQDLLTLHIEDRDACQHVKQRAKAKAYEVEEKLQFLQNLHRVLTDLIRACDERQTTEHCPLLEVLTSNGDAK